MGQQNAQMASLAPGDHTTRAPQASRRSRFSQGRREIRNSSSLHDKGVDHAPQKSQPRATQGRHEGSTPHGDIPAVTSSFQTARWRVRRRRTVQPTRTRVPGA